MAVKKSVSTSTPAGELLPDVLSTPVDVASAENVLKNQYAAQWAFWHQDDTTDANGNVVLGELGQFLEKAIQNGWLVAAQQGDSTKFELELKKTKWYQNNGAQGLLAAKDKYSNPNVWNQSLSRRITDIQQIAAGLGYKLDPKTIQSLAETSLYQAYDATAWNSQAYQTQLQSKIAQTASAAKTPVSAGAGLTNDQKLRAYAQSMGVKRSEDWFKSAVDTINDPASGADYATYQQMIRDAAISQYSGFADLINKGVTVSQIADPYVQAYADELGIAPASVDFTTDPLIQKGLGLGLTEGGVSTPMPLWQFRQETRKDPRWAQTPNARNYVDSIIHQIGRDFGMVG